MTDAEKKLLDEVIKRAANAIADDPNHYSPIAELERAVLLERTPPEFERTLQGLVDRMVESQAAVWEYASRAPLGRKMAGDMLGKARKGRE